MKVQVNSAPMLAHWFVLDTLLLAHQANRDGMHANVLALMRQCVEAMSVIELGVCRHPDAEATLLKWESDAPTTGQLQLRLHTIADPAEPNLACHAIVEMQPRGLRCAKGHAHHLISYIAELLVRTNLDGGESERFRIRRADKPNGGGARPFALFGRSSNRLESAILGEDNGSPIELGMFTGPAYPEISAVIFSNCANMGKLRALSSDPASTGIFTAFRVNTRSHMPQIVCEPKHRYSEGLLDGLRVYHNPFARHPLDPSIFRNPKVFQLYFKDGLPVAEQRGGQLLTRTVLIGSIPDEGS